MSPLRVVGEREGFCLVGIKHAATELDDEQVTVVVTFIGGSSRAVDCDEEDDDDDMRTWKPGPRTREPNRSSRVSREAGTGP